MSSSYLEQARVVGAEGSWLFELFILRIEPLAAHHVPQNTFLGSGSAGGKGKICVFRARTCQKDCTCRRGRPLCQIPVRSSADPREAPPRRGLSAVEP